MLGVPRVHGAGVGTARPHFSAPFPHSQFQSVPAPILDSTPLTLQTVNKMLAAGSRCGNLAVSVKN